MKDFRLGPFILVVRETIGWIVPARPCSGTPPLDLTVASPVYLLPPLFIFLLITIVAEEKKKEQGEGK